MKGEPMKQFESVVATTKVGIDGISFTASALQDLADGSVGKRVIVNFDVTNCIGIVRAAEVIDGQLVVKWEGNEPLASEFNLVPGFISKSHIIDGEQRTIKNAIAMSYGLTPLPAEKDLPKTKEL